MQRSGEERARYWKEISYYSVEWLVFVDEMSATNRRRRRRRGRAKKGKVAYQQERFAKGSQDMNTLIAACNIHGMLIDACVVTDCNNTKEDFEKYMREALSRVLRPFPGSILIHIAMHSVVVFNLCFYIGPNSILVLDNCSLHFWEVIETIVASCKAKIIYLSAYSPDFNPIENCFAQIQKKLWRRYKHSQRSNVDSLYMAMSAITARNMRRYFRRCGYHVPGVDADVAVAVAARDCDYDNQSAIVAAMLLADVI